jgi:hypothetical protein
MDTKHVSLAVVLALSAGIAAQATAQSFTNGNFQTDNLSGWTVVNTANGTALPGSVVSIDIDGPGPLGAYSPRRFRPASPPPRLDDRACR